MSLPPYNPNSQSSAYPNILPPDRNHPQFQEQPQPHSYQFPSNQNQPYPPAQYGVPMTRPAAVDDKSNKRVRVSRACDFCRRKKVKCDAQGPGSICTNCKTYNSECHFNDSAKKRGPPKGYIETLENRLKRMERILGSLADTSEGSKEHAGSDPNDSEPDKSSRESSQDRQVEEPSAKPASIQPSPEVDVAPQPVQKAEERRGSKDYIPYAEYERAKYIGDVSAIHMLTKKYNMDDRLFGNDIGAKFHRFGEDIVLVNDNIGGDKGFDLSTLIKHGNVKPEEKIHTVADWIRIVAGLDMAMSDRLMKVYFIYIHPILPVVNKIMFLKQYRGQIKPFPSAPLLLAMYGAAARYLEVARRQDINKLIDIDEDWQPPENWSESLFDELRKFLVGHYTPSMSTVQALLIAQNHRASLDSRSTIVWLICGLDIRMAQDLGLNRSSDKWLLPQNEIETRKRVWWSIYIADKWNSAATGKPVAIFDEDCDVGYPDEYADWDEIMDTWQEGDPDGPRFPSIPPTSTTSKNVKQPLYQPFVQLAKLSEILGRILRGLYTPKAKKVSMKYGSDAIVTLLDHALTDWRQNLPSSLSLFRHERKADVNARHSVSFMPGMIALCYYTVLQLLHRPFIERNGHGQNNAKSSLSSLSICTSAAIRCISIAEKMNFRESMLFSWNFVVYPVFSSSIIHVYNANSDDEKVRETAKINLKKSTNVFKRLQTITANAEVIYNIFVKVLNIQEIDISNVQEDQQKSSSKKPIAAANTDGNRQNRKESMENMNSGRMANLSDVGRGQTPRRDKRSGSIASVSSPDHDRLSPVASAEIAGTGRPKAVMTMQSSNASNGGENSAASSPSSPSSNEAYSLRQFGLTMDQLFDHIQQNNSGQGPSMFVPESSSGLIPNNNGNSYVAQANELVNLINTPFSDSDLMFGPSVSFFPSLNPTTTAPTPAPQPQQPALSNQPDQQQMADQSMFRHRPENPFWSVPTSLDFDAWNTYYQQRQSESGSLQMMNSNNNDSNMWQ
ncbi:hypothetical protein K450DRAFT_221245 [Umbelopsis ramanniana AG]|uniref:Zn(2)-C6 fungal-type domain-containing protein n=1 Tax=Umbelopsis ramanniana AG TaxID=1314678 RepID=A0AAD5EIA2_UMBRA|nr:uncharacterized protein K450DRAFT_221245 [Umbelopsis ramanniana AG]KAI8584049.1 hypothetical protein K450DRAFT_221245 [Umbelopsis ramanniana AG]